MDDKDRNSYKNAGDYPWKGLGDGEEGVGVGVIVGLKCKKCMFTTFLASPVLR